MIILQKVLSLDLSLLNLFKESIFNLHFDEFFYYDRLVLVLINVF